MLYSCVCAEAAVSHLSVLNDKQYFVIWRLNYIEQEQ